MNKRVTAGLVTICGALLAAYALRTCGQQISEPRTKIITSSSLTEDVAPGENSTLDTQLKNTPDAAFILRTEDWQKYGKELARDVLSELDLGYCGSREDTNFKEQLVGIYATKGIDVTRQVYHSFLTELRHRLSDQCFYKSANFTFPKLSSFAPAEALQLLADQWGDNTPTVVEARDVEQIVATFSNLSPDERKTYLQRFCEEKEEVFTYVGEDMEDPISGEKSRFGFRGALCFELFKKFPLEFQSSVPYMQNTPNTSITIPSVGYSFMNEITQGKRTEEDFSVLAQRIKALLLPLPSSTLQSPGCIPALHTNIVSIVSSIAGNKYSQEADSFFTALRLEYSHNCHESLESNP